MTDLQVPSQHPHMQAEQAILGAIILDSSILLGTSLRLSEECFYDPRHQDIWSAFISLEMNGERIDVLTVADTSTVAAPYLIELTEKCPVAQNMTSYATIVLENFRTRKTYEIIKLHSALGEKIDPVNLGQALIDFSNSLADVKDSYVEWGMNGAGGALVAKLRSEEPMLEGVLNQNSYPKLNKLAPILKGDLCIIGAVSGGGKTAFAMNLCYGFANHGHKGIYFFYESSTDNLQIRITSITTRIPADKIKKKDLTEREMLVIEKRTLELEDNVVYKDVSSKGDIDNLLTHVKAQLKDKDYDYVVIDHMHSMPVKGKMREGTIDITQKFLYMAKEYDIGVIALAQFRKQDDETARPTASLLRESSTIKQDAHHVWFLHDPEHIAKTNPAPEMSKADQYRASRGGQDYIAPPATGAEIIIDKNREGHVGIIPAKFHRDCVLWQEMPDYE